MAQPSSSSSSSGVQHPPPSPSPSPAVPPSPWGSAGCSPLSPTRLLSGGHRRGAPRPGVDFGTPKNPAGPRCLGLRCPKSLHFPGPLGAPCHRTGVPTSHRAHIPCQRRCLGTLCSRCPRGHKAVSEPLMNSALIRGVQLKYQTPPPLPAVCGQCWAGDMTQAGGPAWLLCPPSLAQRWPWWVVSPRCPFTPSTRGGGHSEGVGGIPSALTAAKNTPPRWWQLRGHSGRSEGTQPDSYPEPPRHREPRPR